MPKNVMAVAETYGSVTRPISCDVMRQLFAWTGLPVDTPILHPSAHGTVQQPGSELLQEPLKTELAFNDQVSVEVDGIIEQDRILSTAVLYPDNVFIFGCARLATARRAAAWHPLRLPDPTVCPAGAKEDLSRHGERRRLRRLLRAMVQRPCDACGHRRVQCERRADAGSVHRAPNAHRRHLGCGGRPEVGSREDEGDIWAVGVAFRFKSGKRHTWWLIRKDRRRRCRTKSD